jgi:hypothetical protein
MADEYEGRTQTSKDGKVRQVWRNGMWIRDTSYVAPSDRDGERVKTTPDDMKMLKAASERAATERDTSRVYSGALQAAETMGTGPVKNALLDFITPDEDDGMIGRGIATAVGWLPRALVSQKTLDARDHLKTTSAQATLAAAANQKGAPSDRDVALQRLAGMGPNKGIAENRRIVAEATHKSGLEQARSLITSHWISRYGSVSNRSENGTTFEQAIQNTERRYAQAQQARRLPKAPPRVSRGGTITIDMNGKPIR